MFMNKEEDWGSMSWFEQIVEIEINILLKFSISLDVNSYYFFLYS